MGIPYYFASLLKSHKGIIQPLKKGELIEIDVFAIDFNCLIHRYLKDVDPINSILDALDHILKTVCKAKTIIVAVDGLVPYAKIVNQRYRRMRVKDESIFDRNQISPDTPYMRDLEKAQKAENGAHNLC
jgi:5'-3' exonuclease